MVDNKIEKLSYKLIVSGGASGKTSIIERFVSHRFVVDPVHTSGMKQYTIVKKFPKFSNAEVTFNITDTSSDEKFNTLYKILFKDQVLGVLVYDITNRASFEEMKKKYQFLMDANQQNIIICVCGNKSDLADKQVVPDEEAREFTVQNCLQFTKVSAKTGEGIEEMFINLGERMLEKDMGEYPVDKDTFRKEMGI